MAGVSIRDVATRAGVSIGTVSNVLNRPDSVADGTRAQVLQAIDDLGFVRNESARALRAGRSNSLGFIVPDLSNPFFAALAHGAEELAETRDAVVVLCNSAQSAKHERRHLDQLEQRRVRGIVLTSVAADSDYVDAVATRGTPVVLLDQRSERGSRCSVSVNDTLGGTLAGEHVIGLGHRRLAFAGGPATMSQVADRFLGMRQAAQAAGEGATCRFIETADLTVQAGERVAMQISTMGKRSKPSAVVCANDMLALGLLFGLSQLGVDVPGEVAIVGYDDIRLAGAAAVPLTSVAQPKEEMGRAAVELLFAEIDHPRGHRHRQVVLQPELVVRQSSGQSVTR